MARSFSHLYAVPASNVTPHQQTRQLLKDAGHSYRFFVRMGMAGVLAIALGEVIRRLSG
jgi:hypothetical protein